jgi:hypothetical protein
MPYRPASAHEFCSPRLDRADEDTGCAQICGRRPQGLMAMESEAGGSTIGRFFARAAALEAASVPAFAALACELRALGAPDALQHKVRRAIDDEFDHCARMTALAERFGEKPRTPVVRDMPLRDGFALALDNTVEGCVRESFGALIATYQAAHARDAEVAEAFSRIGQDETRHASLAWQLQAWLEVELTGAQRAFVRAAQRRALAALEREFAIEHERALRELAGLPDRRAALSLHAALVQTLWTARMAAA